MPSPCLICLPTHLAIRPPIQRRTLCELDDGCRMLPDPFEEILLRHSSERCLANKLSDFDWLNLTDCHSVPLSLCFLLGLGSPAPCGKCSPAAFDFAWAFRFSFLWTWCGHGRFTWHKELQMQHLNIQYYAYTSKFVDILIHTTLEYVYII